MEREEPVNVVVVGCGAVARIMYTPALQSLERAGELRVVGLVDPAARQRAEMRESFPGAAGHADMRECGMGPGTLVVVATPPRLHAEQSVYALSRGAAVLCEKPMAASSAEAERMLAAAAETGGILAVGFYRRFFPASEAIKSILEAKPFGELLDFSVEEGRKFAWDVASDALFKRSTAVGGVLYDAGIHVVDLLHWWLGEPLGYTYQDDAMGGVEANCRIGLSYAGGVSGSVHLSWDWDTQNRYAFNFEKGTVVYHVGDANRLSLLCDGVPYVIGGELTTAAPDHAGLGAGRRSRTNVQSFTEQLRNVVGAMKGREGVRVTGEEGIRSLRFIEGCYAGRTLMPMPWLTDAERRAAELLAARGR